MSDRSMNGDDVEGKSKHGQYEGPDADKVAKETGFRNSIMCWNVKMSKDPYAIRKYIEQYEVSIIGIVETRLHQEDLKEVCDEIKKDWVWESNADTITDERGIRILVGWDPKSVTVSVCETHEQALHLFIKTCDETEGCYCSIIYAKGKHKARQSLWSNMWERKSIVGSDPWFIMGDVKATRSHADMNASSYNIKATFTTDFNQIVSALNMDDVPCTCPGEKMFTCGKRRGQNGRIEKVDWVMANKRFLIKYPHSSARYLDFTHYRDHKPAILVFDKRFVDIEILQFMEKVQLLKGQLTMEALERVRIMFEQEMEDKDGKKQGRGKNVDDKDQTKSLSVDDGGMYVSKVGAERNVDVNGLSTATKRIRSATKNKVKETKVDVEADALPKTVEEGKSNKKEPKLSRRKKGSKKKIKSVEDDVKASADGDDAKEQESYKESTEETPKSGSKNGKKKQKVNK